MKPTLLILAAGMGSRYGGLKQLDPLGPSGETILDYSVYDAIRAGFGKVVFIIRHEIEKEFRAFFDGRFGNRLKVEYVFQELSNLPGGFKAPASHTKPWGT
ncbi:MAG: nucleotidyltransferase, partial [Bacteroidetes bacterium HGW-Bacteroidetes-22]